MGVVTGIVVLIALIWHASGLQQVQEGPQNPPPREQQQVEPEVSENFFSGTVTSLASDHVRVARAEETKTFRLTSRTKIEGRLAVQARVTVGYATAEQGDVAIRIIVRQGQERRSVAFWPNPL